MKEPKSLAPSCIKKHIEILKISILIRNDNFYKVLERSRIPLKFEKKTNWLFLNPGVKEPNWVFHKLTKLQFLFGYFTQFVNSDNSQQCQFAYLPPTQKYTRTCSDMGNKIIKLYGQRQHLMPSLQL